MKAYLTMGATVLIVVSWLLGACALLWVVFLNVPLSRQVTRGCTSDECSRGVEVAHAQTGTTLVTSGKPLEFTVVLPPGSESVHVYAETEKTNVPPLILQVSRNTEFTSAQLIEEKPVQANLQNGGLAFASTVNISSFSENRKLFVRLVFEGDKQVRSDIPFRTIDFSFVSPYSFFTRFSHLWRTTHQ